MILGRKSWAWVIVSFMLPMYDAIPNGCGPGMNLCRDLQSYSIWGSKQSQTWVDSSAVMLADSKAFDRLWPIVRMQAEPQRMYTNYTDSIGTQVILTIPPTIYTVFWATCRDSSGNESCITILRNQ